MRIVNVEASNERIFLVQNFKVLLANKYLSRKKPTFSGSMV